MDNLTTPPFHYEFVEFGGFDLATPEFQVLDSRGKLLLVVELANFAETKKRQLSLKPQIEELVSNIVNLINRNGV